MLHGHREGLAGLLAIDSVTRPMEVLLALYSRSLFLALLLSLLTCMVDLRAMG